MLTFPALSSGSGSLHGLLPPGHLEPGQLLLQAGHVLSPDTTILIRPQHINNATNQYLERETRKDPSSTWKLLEGLLFSLLGLEVDGNGTRKLMLCC